MKVIFNHTQRDRPIVLTEHQLLSLEQAVGRDVLVEVQRLAASSYEAKTLGQLLRTLTKTLQEESHRGLRGSYTIAFPFDAY